jgi:hypothetical protein
MSSKEQEGLQDHVPLEGGLQEKDCRDSIEMVLGDQYYRTLQTSKSLVLLNQKKNYLYF